MTKPSGFVRNTYGWLRDVVLPMAYGRIEPTFRSARIPRAAEEYLQPSNPRLSYLVSRYDAFGSLDHSLWERWSKRVDLVHFRGEGHYLAQRAYGASRLRYVVTAAYVDAVDDWGLLYTLGEDSLFGAVTYHLPDGLIVSRDLLDSILEMVFLRNCLQLDRAQPVVGMDVGAGYGRFAHRFAQTFPSGFVYCLDAVPVSTFLCEFYISFRGFASRAPVVPLFEVPTLTAGRVDFAMNVHSWSECPLQAVTFWLGVLADLRVRHVFVVPHEARFLTMERDGSRVSFLPEILRHGYRPTVEGNKYGHHRLVQKCGIYDAPYIMFEMKA